MLLHCHLYKCLFIMSIISFGFITLGIFFSQFQMKLLHCQHQLSPNNCTYLCSTNEHKRYCYSSLSFQGQCLSSSKTIMYYDSATDSINGTFGKHSQCPSLYFSNTKNTFGMGFLFFGIITLSGIILVIIDYKTKCHQMCYFTPNIEKIVKFVVFRSPHYRITPDEQTVEDPIYITEQNVQSDLDVELFNDGNTQIII